MEELIFSVEAHSSKELRHFKFISVSFMAQLLSSASFIGKVNKTTSSNSLPVSLKCVRWIHVTNNCRRNKHWYKYDFHVRYSSYVKVAGSDDVIDESLQQMQQK